MSNFLTNFQSGDYDKKNRTEQQNTDEQERVDAPLEDDILPEIDEPRTEELGSRLAPTQSNQRRHAEEETEIDPTYRKRQRQKRKLIIVISFVAVVSLALVIYQLTHIAMPDFVGKPISEVQNWATKNKMTITTKQAYSLKQETNEIIKQPIAKNKQVKKGKALQFTISKGADPEEVLKLPDFKGLSTEAAEKWLEDNKLEKLKIVSEFDEKIASKQLLRMELNDGAVAESFKRKDSGTLYYSKGKEVFKKEISVPDFAGKMKSEIETWAKTNSIEVAYNDVPSHDQEIGKVLKQSIAPKEKIAKQTKMAVDVSAGKPIKVPDFSTLTPETAATVKDLNVTVKQQYSPDVSYGQLIWQTIEAGTELTEKDDLDMTVTYSEGRPYLKDFTGETEGSLQKLFFDEYTSKGANIYYTIKYVSSEEKQGTVVGMSAFNTYVPLEYTVEISISSGN